MSDLIKIGLDFGTHQTKICVRRTPDEGHGEPIYEFFTFRDQNGKEQYVLPSIIQVNKDETLSYGYVNPNERKGGMPHPVMDKSRLIDGELDVLHLKKTLLQKYCNDGNTEEEGTVLNKMIESVKDKLHQIRLRQEKQIEEKYVAQMNAYRKNGNLYRYFKQATFAQRDWIEDTDPKILCIWYLAYVIFLLEDKYGQNFAINMGIPTDNKNFVQKKQLAVEVLANAYQLVENVFNNDKEAFLGEKKSELLKKTRANYVFYSDEIKYEYNINVFPEAYAGLISLTSKGKLATGMSITVDIGGGTTDISFFTIQKNKPVIYRYNSIARGLNYIAELSGFDYSNDDFGKYAKPEIIGKFNNKKQEIVSILRTDLSKQFSQETCLPKSRLYDALANRIVVYMGGGSSYDFLTNGIACFSDVHVIDTSLWLEENIKDMAKVAPLCKLLTTAYGLSISESDEDVKLEPFTTLFNNFPKYSEYGRAYVDKDQC